jgi:hypothetical protein
MANCSELSTDSVLIYYKNTQGKNTFQSRPVFNNRFIITDSLTRPSYALILFKNLNETITDSDFETRAREIYLEPGLLSLVVDASQMDSLKLSGSQSEDEWAELYKNISRIRQEMLPLTERYT